MLRPERFDRIIEIPLPDAAGRLSILKVHTLSLTMDKGVNLNEIDAMIDSRNEADLKAICMETGLFEIRKEHPVITQQTQQDFIATIEKIKTTFSRIRHADAEGTMFA